MMKCILIILHLLIQDTTTLNKENLQYQLKQQEIQFPEVVYAQALLESNSFKSPLCRNYHNVFGMSYPVRRNTVAKRGHRYAKYDTWIQSVIDYKLFQKYILRNRELTKQKYINYICKNYAKDKAYRKNLTRIMTADEARAKTLSDTTKEVNKKITALDIKIQSRIDSNSKLREVNIEIKNSIEDDFKKKVIELGYTISKIEVSRYNTEINTLTINW